MKHLISVWVLAMVFAASVVTANQGAYSPVAVTNTEVVAAAEFAINAQEQHLQDERKTESTRLKMIKILSAQQQVVAGMNYRLILKVNIDGQEKEAEAVVWWQAWRKPDPYQLTSWTWKN